MEESRFYQPTEEFSLDTDCHSWGSAGLCALSSPRGFLIKKCVLVRIDLWHFCQPHPWFGPQWHVFLRLDCDCILSFHICRLLHLANKAAVSYAWHAVLRDWWITAAFKACARILHYAASLSVSLYQNVSCYGLSEVEVSCFWVQANLKSVRYCQIKRQG